MFYVSFFEVDRDRCHYNPVTQELFVGFTLTTMRKYYQNIPEDVWLGLRAARYADDYYRYYIESVYRGREIKK